MEMINTFINGAIEFTLASVVLTLCIFALVSTWKWLIGLAIKFIQWLFPGLTNHKKK
nr:MAG TPA: hypothetical protein [Caudoviricetes sp.]